MNILDTSTKTKFQAVGIASPACADYEYCVSLPCLLHMSNSYEYQVRSCMGVTTIPPRGELLGLARGSQPGGTR